jgi:hypothetical protein
VGQPSPHGGTITRKEVIGLDPARDANGVDHPDKFIPRLRVYVKMQDGSEKYYDAPATEGGGTDPNDKVTAVNMGNAMEFMGQMGTLATTMQHPVLASKLAEGGKQLSKQEQKYLDELTALSKPTKVETTENVRIPADGGETRRYTKDSTGKVTKSETIKHPARTFRPPSGGAAVGVLKTKLEALDEELTESLENAETQEEKDALNAQYKEDRRAVIAGIKPKTGGAGANKTPSNAEQNSAVNGAVEIAAGKLGLTYEKLTGTYKNADGTSATPEQKAKLSAARAAATVAVRDASAGEGNKRVPGAKLNEIATTAVGSAAAKSKYEKNKVYTNAKGERATFGGVDEQGKNIWLAP